MMHTGDQILLLREAAREVSTARLREGLERWADELGNVYWRRGRNPADPPTDLTPPFDVYLNPSLGDLQGVLTEEGEVIVAGVNHPNPTDAIPPEVRGKKNGWQEWRWKDSKGREHRIETLKNWHLVRTSGKRRR